MKKVNNKKSQLPSTKTRFFSRSGNAKLSIYAIALTGVFLPFLILTKYLDLVMPRVGGYAIYETYWTMSCLIIIILPIYPAILCALTAPFLWFVMGQTSLIGPLSFFFDYSIPILATLLVKLAKNKYDALWWILLAGIIRWTSQTMSGVLYWSVNFQAALIIDSPVAGVTTLITMAIIFSLFTSLAKIKRRYVAQKEGQF